MIKEIKGLKHLSYEERLRELGLPREGRLRGDFVNLYKCRQGECKEDEVRLFPVVPSDRIRGNGHKLKLLPEHQETFSFSFLFLCNS